MINCTAADCTADCAERETAPISNARQLGRLVALTVAVTFGVLFIAVAAGLPRRGATRGGAVALQRVSRWILRALGIRVVVDGAPRSGPSLVVGNHISWIDVLVLQACAPMRPVAKAEVGRWPVIGKAAIRSGTLFLRRERLRELPDAVAAMTAALRSGSRVQVFPEGTTRCGGAVNPFRRAAFQAAIDAGVVVSPVAVRYSGAERRPSSAPAFVGDETLADSLRRVVSMPLITAQVCWLRPIPAVAGTGRNHVDRATVARLAENAVARHLGLHVLRPARPASLPPAEPVAA